MIVFNISVIILVIKHNTILKYPGHILLCVSAVALITFVEIT